VEPGALARCLTTRVRQTLEGPITSPLTVKAAAETRDALAKVLYAKLFDWLVERINGAIGEDTWVAGVLAGWGGLLGLVWGGWCGGWLLGLVRGLGTLLDWPGPLLGEPPPQLAP
jgi:hypothetical protein